MAYSFPFTIENAVGEKIIFKNIIQEADGDRLLLEGIVKPKCGPPMHVHFKQEESLTVMKGKMGYQVQGGAEKFAGEGETVLFKRGVAHRFWNAGEDDLYLDNWVKPANSIVFFLSSLYAAQNKPGDGQPEKFDGAYLVTRYKNEYNLPELPAFVKKVIMPITYQLGRLLGKYKKFKDAPEPL